MQTEEKLGFAQIRDLVAAECSNALALQMAREMRFHTTYERVMRDLEQTDEMRRIILLEDAFPSQDFFDLTEELTRLKVGNTVIELQALFDMKVSLRVVADCCRFLLRSETYPRLRQLASQVEWDAELPRLIARIVDDKGEVPDSASPELQEIRRQIRRKRDDVDRQIARSLAHAKQQGWAPEGAEPTIRNGRSVIPLLDTHRRKLRGLIHDESATRQTAYLEPAEVVELNNDLRDLEFAERREVIRILATFTETLRPRLPQLINTYWFLARLDFLRAKARFALSIGAGLPIVHDRPQIDWLDARHPLLMLAFRQRHASHPELPAEEVVPFSLRLDADHRILIISGPNAGGKSVCLKAVGLVQYMLQAGMLVPCRETSEFGLFGDIFIDIGDQQSIDDDLSTYSSHLQNMKTLLASATDDTLFLLDELGAGTEPRSGCAIAEASLEELYRRGSFGVATTHFADLKSLADRYSAIQNGAMLFDTDRMRPLYRLSVGLPGSSFAFEIASNIGFPHPILEAAAEKVGGEMLNFEQQLQQLELEKQEVARRKEQLDVRDAFLNEVVEKYQRLTEQLESRKYDIVSAARAEAKQILAEANRTVERTIADIRTAQAAKEPTQEARQRLREAGETIERQQHQHDETRRRQRQQASQPSPTPVVRDEAVPGPIAVGDIVRIDGQETFGHVTAVRGQKAVVESNALRMTIALDRLTKTRRTALPVDRTTRRESRFQSIYDDINEKRKHFNPTLDLRGQRAEEALAALLHFLDEASLLGEKELRVLHGTGYGVLKTLVRQQLRRNPAVAAFRAERVELGGEGLTVVELR